MQWSPTPLGKCNLSITKRCFLDTVCIGVLLSFTNNHHTEIDLPDALGKRKI